jgi:hypothetical protein
MPALGLYVATAVIDNAGRPQHLLWRRTCLLPGSFICEGTAVGGPHGAGGSGQPSCVVGGAVAPFLPGAFPRSTARLCPAQFASRALGMDHPTETRRSTTRGITLPRFSSPGARDVCLMMGSCAVAGVAAGTRAAASP